MSSWLYVILAICLELAGTTCTKLSEGFTKPWPSVFIFVFYSLAFVFLTLAVTKIELSVVYAIWSGLGIVLITVIGFLWLNESVNLVKIGAISLIIVGVVILKLNPESVIVQEKGILSGESAGMDKIETTQPVKAQDILPPTQNDPLLMPQSPIKYPELEGVSISEDQQPKTLAKD